MSFKQISCRQQNHYNMPFQYICQQPSCLKNSRFVACIYCCEQIHKTHIDKIKSLKALINQITRNHETTQFNGIEILLNGIKNCSQQSQLKHNLQQLIYFYYSLPKNEKLLDIDLINQKKEAQQFYQRIQANPSQQILQKTIKKQKKKALLCSNTSFINPVLTFPQNQASLQGYRFISPFCIANPLQKMTTVFAHPPLNRYDQSVQLDIKIEKLTPHWLGIGVSKGKKNYEDQSRSHIMMTSNGWVCIEGKTSRTKVKYSTKDTLKIKWDKLKSILQFVCQGERETINLGLKWNQDIYLCIVLFYKGDSVQLLG